MSTVSIEYQGGTPDAPSYLVCDKCMRVLYDGTEPVELEYLVGVLQGHAYECRDRVMVDHRFCGTCGDQLYTVGVGGTPRCQTCNLLIPEAMQTEHKLEWDTYEDQRFAPACTCGWRSEVAHLTEKNARSAWDRHPKRRPRTNLRSI